MDISHRFAFRVFHLLNNYAPFVIRASFSFMALVNISLKQQGTATMFSESGNVVSKARHNGFHAQAREKSFSHSLVQFGQQFVVCLVVQKAMCVQFFLSTFVWIGGKCVHTAADVVLTFSCSIKLQVPLPAHCQIATKKKIALGDEHGVTAVHLLPGIQPPDTHIDGLYAPGNGVPENQIHNFTLIVGVPLTNMSSTNAGNFGVIPGSHKAIERAIRRLGILESVKRLTEHPDGRSAKLGNLLNLVDLAPPQSLCTSAGTPVIAHYQTAHFVQPNVYGDEDRVVVYFRITHPRRDGHSFCPEALENVFLELPGIAKLPA